MKHYVFKENGETGKCGFSTSYAFRDGGIIITWNGETRKYNIASPVIITTGEGFPTVMSLVAPKRRGDLLAWLCAFGPKVRARNLDQFNDLVLTAGAELQQPPTIVEGHHWKAAILGAGKAPKRIAIYIDVTSIDSIDASELLGSFASKSFPKEYIIDKCKKVGLQVTL